MSVGGGLSIWNHAALCQSLVDAFVDVMVALGWPGSLYTIGNDDTC
jgi:hypothetical protein